MTYTDTDPEAQRVRFEVRRFRQHFVTYVAVVGLIFLVNMLTGGHWFGHWVVFWVALIWGVILALEGVHLFGEDVGKDWEDRMVAQILARRRRKADTYTASSAEYRYAPPEPPSPSAAAAGPAAPETPPAVPPVA
jgi:hypothetical protein